MARPTNEKKDSNIILRLSDEMKQEIEKEARDQNKAVSEYIREILRNRGNKALKGVSNKVISDLEYMCHITGGDLNIMLTDLRDRLDSGELDMDEGIVLFE